MLRTLSKKLTTIILILVFGFTMKAQTPDKTFEILKNLEIMGATYKQVYLFYVNETNPGALMKTAIDAMLQSLDPYTVYIPEANIEDVRMLKEGQYEGIGSIIMQRDKKTYIAEVYEHFPAQKAGLKPGDQILAINGTDIAQKNIEEISHLLKGQVNTTLTINIIPLGEKEPKEMSIQREAIHFDNVTYSTLFENQTGYIRLDGFTEGAAKEFKESFLKLKEQGADKLVIDLRNNGGGLMNEAISIVALFIDKGLPVVSMKGKQQENDQTFLTENDPLDKNIPIVVLINRSSASASEILAGALQDYDRAVIMGQRSFGKGLVQNIVPLNYHAQLKITTAKYYVPSGRCVQAIDYGNRDKQGIAHKLPDSLRTAYKTQNGRTVYDGDGIEPDVELATKNLSDIATSLLESYNIFDFANDYALKHKTISQQIKTFNLSDSDFDAFCQYLKIKNFDYRTDIEKSIETLSKCAKDDGYYDDLQKEIGQLKNKLTQRKGQDLQIHKDEILMLLNTEIINRYYYEKGAIEYSLTKDTDLQEAQKLLSDLEKVNKLLR